MTPVAPKMAGKKYKTTDANPVNPAAPNSEETNDDDTKQDTILSQSQSQSQSDDAAEEEEDVRESGQPKWLRYAKHKPKPYFKRKFLGGNESASALVLGFLLDVFNVRGTVLIRCCFPMLWAIGVSVLVRLLAGGETRDLLPADFFLPFALATLITLFIRLFWSWRNYQRGHEKVLEMTTHCIDAMMVATTSPHIRSRGMDVLELMRKVIVMLAFIRQDLREARQHLCDTTPFMSGWRKKRLAAEAFQSDSSQFIQDRHGAPPLRVVLNSEEKTKFKGYSSHDRVVVAAAAARIHFNKYVHLGEQRVLPPDGRMFLKSISKVLENWDECRAIVRTPTPFVLHHFITVLLLFYACFLAPLYFSWGQQGWICVVVSALNALAFYGTEEASKEMEVPFGWRQSDCSLTKACRNVLKRTYVLCTVGKIVVDA